MEQEGSVGEAGSVADYQSVMSMEVDGQVDGGAGRQGLASQGNTGFFSGQVSQVLAEESEEDRVNRVAEQLQQDEEGLLHRVSDVESESALAELWTQTYSCMERVN